MRGDESRATEGMQADKQMMKLEYGRNWFNMSKKVEDS